MRRARERNLPAELFGEPAWDMLLALCGARREGLSVATLCDASGVPESSVVRWIRVLEDKRLVALSSGTGNQCSDLVSLTDEGRVTLERALRAMTRAASE